MRRMKILLATVACIATAGSAYANDEVMKLQKDPNNWAMQLRRLFGQAL